jgi:hypothetical protein
VGDSVFLAEILKEGGERRQPMPDRCAAEIPASQLIPPGNYMGPCDGSEILRPCNAGKADEIRNGILVNTTGARISDVGKPLDLRGDYR